MFARNNLALAATCLCMAAVLLACAMCGSGSSVSAAQASPAPKIAAAVVDRVRIVHLNYVAPDKTRVDEYKVVLYNDSRAKDVWFKVWGVNDTKQILPTVIRADGGTRLIEPKTGKWKTRLRPDSKKVVTFTAHAGADNYCAEGVDSLFCSNSPDIIIED